MKKIALIVLLLAYGFSSYSQLSNNRLRAIYLINLLKYIEWENQENIDTFVVGVYGSRSMYQILKENSKNKTIKTRPFIVRELKVSTDVSKLNILYLGKKKNNDIVTIATHIKGKRILLFTDSCSSREQIMINFLTLNKGDKQYEINRKNLELENFKVSPRLIIYGGSVKDLRFVYNMIEKELEEEQAKLLKQRKIVEAQQLEIVKQKQKITIQIAEIEKQETAIKKQQEEISNQNEKIVVQKKHLAELQRDLSAQQKLLNERKAFLEIQKIEIEKQEIKMKEQQDKMDSRNAILEKQMVELDNLNGKIVAQKDTLGKQFDMIETQRLILYVFIVFLTIVLVLVYFIFRAYKAKRKVNKELGTKNIAIIQQNEEITVINEQLQGKNEEIQQQKSEIEQQHQQLEKVLDNIKLLSEFGNKLTATLNIESITDMIYSYIASLIDASSFGIAIYNDSKETLDYITYIELDRKIQPFSKLLSDDNCLSVLCYKKQQEILINDLQKDYKKYISDLSDIYQSKLIQSVIYLPLTVEEKRIGIISVNSFSKNAYSLTDYTNMQTLASYISIALDNAKAYRIVKQQHEQIRGSIRYACSIQQAILPVQQSMDKYFENFIIYKPKDIVSGDFYWFAPLIDQSPEIIADGKSIKRIAMIAAVDCTGHGVPGAFMSMIGSRLLNEIVNEKKETDPQVVLELLNKNIIKSLKQEQSLNTDGMDVCLIRLSIISPTSEVSIQTNNSPIITLDADQSVQVDFCGAKRPLYFFEGDDRVKMIKGDVKTVGGQYTKRFSFTRKQITLNKGDAIYLTTDGYMDQNNNTRKSFGSKRFLQILNTHLLQPMSVQKTALEEGLDKYQGKEKQRDDITLLGIRIL